MNWLTEPISGAITPDGCVLHICRSNYCADNYCWLYFGS